MVIASSWIWKDHCQNDRRNKDENVEPQTKLRQAAGAAASRAPVERNLRLCETLQPCRNGVPTARPRGLPAATVVLLDQSFDVIREAAALLRRALLGSLSPLWGPMLVDWATASTLF